MYTHVDYNIQDKTVGCVSAKLRMAVSRSSKFTNTYS